MGTTAPALGWRPWQLAALTTGIVLIVGTVVTGQRASAQSAPASVVAKSPDPVLVCRMPLGSPVPTPRATATLPAVAAPPAALPVPAARPAGTVAGAVAQPDTIPPSAPGNLTAMLVDPTRATLTWSAATDNIGVTGYEIWGSVYSEVPGWATICAMTRIATVPGAETAVDLNLVPPPSPGLIFVRYTVFTKAVDAAGNVSTQSNSAQLTVPYGEPS